MNVFVASKLLIIKTSCLLLDLDFKQALLQRRSFEH